MSLQQFSDDQQEVYDRLIKGLSEAGIDVSDGGTLGPQPNRQRTLSVLGKAGTGKTLLLARLGAVLADIGVQTIADDMEAKPKDGSRSLAILAPTNKAASVLRNRGINATTIHRILYRPLYDPDYEKIVDWLTAGSKRPEIEKIDDSVLDRIANYYEKYNSLPGALVAAGLRGSDFILGWKRRDEPLDIGFVDEASMLDKKQLEDLQEIFSTLILFGDPAQLAPVGQSGEMSFEALDEKLKHRLTHIHRQADGNPILDMAHLLADPLIDFDAFEAAMSEAAKRDERIVLARAANSDLMARSPVLVWRNQTRMRLIKGFRIAHKAPDDELLSGEPLICDGIELPMKHRKKRLDLEARGLIKGAQVIYLGPGRRAGFSRLHVLGAQMPRVGAASIIKIEDPDQDEPFIPYAATMGAAFVHGAACTIHKAQGSQWREVQVFAPDILAAARAGRVEAGLPLWKRLAYVAITRAAERLHWVQNYRLSKPLNPLGTDDLLSNVQELTLSAPEETA